MPIIGTVSSGYYVEPVYTLAQTFDSSGTFTVPAGVTKIALVGVSAGGGGGAYAFFDSPSGGSGGVAFIHKDVSTAGGTTFTVTVGSGGNSASAGGALTFGNVFTANGGGAGRAYGVAPNTGNVTSNSGSTESSAVSAGRQMYQGSVPPNLSVSSSDSNLGTYNASGGGGAGGLGGRWTQPEEGDSATPPNNTWVAGATGAGNGGNGGTVNGAYSGNMGNAGNAATQPGGGGGSAGHTGYGPNGYNPNPGQSRSGGAGFRGQVLVYVK
jgi:trimeric autotransporter adhesin